VIALNVLLAVTTAANTIASDKTTRSTTRRPLPGTLADSESSRRRLNQIVEIPIPRMIAGMKA
jgi:hypothetical protein